VLVAGLGAGVTAGSFAAYPHVEKIVISEVEPLIASASGRYFSAESSNVLNDKRTFVVNTNVRRYLTATKNKFDVITSDGFHPWVNPTLFSKEYFDICKQHLNPGGIVAQWLPLYDTDLETIKTEIATVAPVRKDMERTQQPQL
jgi:spermidine synthase